jgi:hypothetical protein
LARAILGDVAPDRGLISVSTKRIVGVGGEPISYSGLSYDSLLRQYRLPKQTVFEKMLTPPLPRVPRSNFLLA